VALRDDMRMAKMVIMADMHMAGGTMAEMHTDVFIMPDLDTDTDGAVK